MEGAAACCCDRIGGKKRQEWIWATRLMVMNKVTWLNNLLFFWWKMYDTTSPLTVFHFWYFCIISFQLHCCQPQHQVLQLFPSCSIRPNILVGHRVCLPLASKHLSQLACCVLLGMCAQRGHPALIFPATPVLQERLAMASASLISPSVKRAPLDLSVWEVGGFMTKWTVFFGTPYHRAR